MRHHHISLPIVSILLMGAAAPFEDTSLLDRQVAAYARNLAGGYLFLSVSVASQAGRTEVIPPSRLSSETSR